MGAVIPFPSPMLLEARRACACLTPGAIREVIREETVQLAAINAWLATNPDDDKLAFARRETIAWINALRGVLENVAA